MLKRLLLLLTILVACVGCDQTTKSMAKPHLSEAEAVSLLGGSVRLQIAKNYGAFLSIGASLPGAARTTLLSAGVAAVLCALFAYCIVAAPGNRVVVPALGMIIGGGVSNLIDRLSYGGYVLDFLNVGMGPVRTGIFNLADVFIMTGVLLLVVGDWLSNRMQDRRIRHHS